jgi:hypothetical protein
VVYTKRQANKARCRAARLPFFGYHFSEYAYYMPKLARLQVLLQAISVLF